MAEWYCFKCKQKMVETDVTAFYMDVVNFIKGLKCPQCGTTYLTEKIAVEVVNKGEAEVEAKLG